MKSWKRWTAAGLSLLLAATAMPVTPNALAAERMVTDADLLDTQEMPEAWGAVPNEEQLWYQKQGLAAFCHFGPNTFNNVEWGYYGDDAQAVFPIASDFDFDIDNIVKNVKEAGFSRIMMTVKHHDGFCLWPTETTTFNISQSTYRDGKGDLLEELSDACTKYNLDMGIYLSPWDIHEDYYGCYGTNNNKENSKGYTDYNKVYIDSIKEICTAVKTDENGDPLLDENGNTIPKYGNNHPDRRSKNNQFVEWWMDGATGQGNHTQKMDWRGIIEAIRETNPDCQIFGTHAATNSINGEADRELASTGGVHWIGNEDGFASDCSWAKVYQGQDYEAQKREENQYVPEGEQRNKFIRGRKDGDLWSVPECDAKMLRDGWFWSEAKGKSVRSMSNLADIYFRSVGHGAALLLNLSPNTSGRVDDTQMGNFMQLAQSIKDTFDEDLTKQPGVSVKASSVWKNSKACSPSNVIDEIPEGEVYDETFWAPAEGETTGTLEINLGGLKKFDVISIEEYIQKGQAISSFSVEYRTVDGEWIEFGRGDTISSKRLIRGEKVQGTAIRVNILAAESTPMINNVGVFEAAEDFSVSGEEAIVLPGNLEEISATADGVTTTGTWGSATSEEEGTHTWATNTNNDAWDSYSKEFTFIGTKAWAEAVRDPAHGEMEIYLDGELCATVNTEGSRKAHVIFWESEELEYGEHTVKLVPKGKTIDIHGIRYQDGSGIFQMKEPQYQIVAGKSAEVEIVRTAGSKGEAVIHYVTPSGSAEQGVNYEYQTGNVTFADGERSKKITLRAFENVRQSDGMDFYFTISSDDASVGDASASRIVIRLPESIAREELLEEVKRHESKIEAGQGAYNDETWKKYVEAYEAAKKVAAGTSLEEVGRLEKALKEAEAALSTEKPAPIPDPEPLPTPVPQPPQEGSVLEDASGTYRYRVTDASGKTVEVVGFTAAHKKDKAVKLNHVVKLSGADYKVTAVASKAFKGSKNVTKVTGGKYLQKIGANAFAGCKKLKSVAVQSKSLKEIGASAFSGDKLLKKITLQTTGLKKVGAKALKGIHKKAVVKVPKKKLKAYKKLLAKKGQAKSVKIK